MQLSSPLTATAGMRRILTGFPINRKNKLKNQAFPYSSKDRTPSINTISGCALELIFRSWFKAFGGLWHDEGISRLSLKDGRQMYRSLHFT